VNLRRTLNRPKIKNKTTYLHVKLFNDNVSSKEAEGRHEARQDARDLGPPRWVLAPRLQARELIAVTLTLLSHGVCFVMEVIKELKD